MTHKLALCLSLFASASMMACSVDSPTPDDFDYSFQEELPEDFASELGFAVAPYDSGLRLLFRDSLDGVEHVDPSVASVPLVLRRIMVERVDSEGHGTWHSLRDEPITIDLLDFADGDVESLGGGPLPAGRYETVVVEIVDLSVLDISGEESDVRLPGKVLSIESSFSLAADGASVLTLQFGGLRQLMLQERTWTTEPVVSITVEEYS